MKRYGWLAILLAFLMTGCFLSKSPEEKGKEVVHSISRSARLYTVQYNVHKVLTYQDFSSLETSFLFEKITIPIPGERKIVLPMDAVLKAYIDFSSFSDENVSVVGDHITITLPAPKIEMTSAKVDYTGEKQFLSWNRFSFTEDERESLLRKGREKVLADMKGSDIIERSQLGAYNALVPLVEAAGFRRENIVIRFDQELLDKSHNEQFLLKMIERETL